jgi:hypothetical protein
MVLLLHFSYYLLFLSTFPEHQDVIGQWKQPWFLHAENMIPAYILVASIALWNVLHTSTRGAIFTEPGNRVLLAWFIGAFLLANHEMFISPIQPLHYTRGYIWSSLFLIGAPSLVALLDHLLASGRTLRRMCLVAIVLVFLTDNLTWVGVISTTSPPTGITMTSDQRQLLRWLSTSENEGTLLLSQDALISDLSTVYTPLRTWCAHRGLTPFYESRRKEVERFFATSETLQEWDPVRLIVVYHPPPADSIIRSMGRQAFACRSIEKEYRNESYYAVIFSPCVRHGTTP